MNLLQLTSLTLNDYQRDSNDEPKPHGEQCLSRILSCQQQREKEPWIVERAHWSWVFMCSLTVILACREKCLLYIAFKLYMPPWVSVSKLIIAIFPFQKAISFKYIIVDERRTTS